MGNNGSDFTVGAVRLKNGMGNFFKGQMGGLAVFNRALTSDEIFKIFSVKFSLKNPEGLQVVKYL